jgi:hypothetical protein
MRHLSLRTREIRKNSPLVLAAPCLKRLSHRPVQALRRFGERVRLGFMLLIFYTRR